MSDQINIDFGNREAIPASFNDAPPDALAIRLDSNGVHWIPAILVRRTCSRVTVLFEGKTATLGADTFENGMSWSSRHHCRFARKRGGLAEIVLEALWAMKFGPANGSSISLLKARVLLGLGTDYSQHDVKTAFRDRAKSAHPDRGGDAGDFQMLVSARAYLLARLGGGA